MAICYAFMIPVDGWLTKHSAPIVIYRPEDTSGIYPIWDIPLEEYVYAFALLTAGHAHVGSPGCTCGRRPGAGGCARMNPVVLVVGCLRGHGGRELRRPPLGDARLRDGAGTGATTRPPGGRFESNDLFPVCFSAVGVLLFALGSLGLDAVWWVGRRRHGLRRLLPVRARGVHPPPPARPGAEGSRYLEWLRDSHRVHHLTSAEPYGMLLPLVRAEARARQPRRPATRWSAPGPSAERKVLGSAAGEEALGSLAVVALDGDEGRVDERRRRSIISTTPLGGFQRANSGAAGDREPVAVLGPTGLGDEAVEVAGRRAAC